MSRRWHRRGAVAVVLAVGAALVAATGGSAQASPALRSQPGAAGAVPEIATSGTVMVGTVAGTTPVEVSTEAELGTSLEGASPAVQAAARAYFAAGGSSLLVVPTADASVGALAGALAPGGALDAAFSQTGPSLLVVPEISGLEASQWSLVAQAAVGAAARLEILALLDPSQEVLAPVAGRSAQGQAADAGAVDQVVEALAGTADALRSASASPQNGVLYAGSLVAAQGGGEVVPTAAVMAGVTAVSDSKDGIWNAPAGVALPLTGWVPQLVVDNDQQGVLNQAGVDAARVFPGQGTVMWGARTLSAEYQFRYVQVVRTYAWVERSLQGLLDQAAFAPNDAVTWEALTASASGFLQDLWSQGGLMGEKASDAYNVQMGLGTTMTSQDVLDGYMRMNVQLDMVQPAEYLEMDLVTQVAS